MRAESNPWATTGAGRKADDRGSAQLAEQSSAAAGRKNYSLSLAERLELTYEVLTDVGLAVARSYGLVFELPDYLQETHERLGHPVTRFNGTADQTLPRPATLVVDAGGVIRFAFADANYIYRADPAGDLRVLDELA